MENENIQIVKDSIEQITNAKNFDHVYDYYDKECVFHNPPYVGTGTFINGSSGSEL